MLSALQRWPAAMLHTVVLCCVVLVEKPGAVPGASLWHTEQMPYTNKQPAGARAASPSILCCYINSKCWDLQRLQQRLGALTLTTTANMQSNPTGPFLLFACGKLLTLSPAALELHMIVFLVMGKGLLWICSLYLSTQRDYCQKLSHILKLSCLCAAVAAISTDCREVWRDCDVTVLKSSTVTTFLLPYVFSSQQSLHMTERSWLYYCILWQLFFSISTTPIWRLFVALIVGSIPTSNNTHSLPHMYTKPPNTSTFTHAHT